MSTPGMSGTLRPAADIEEDARRAAAARRRRGSCPAPRSGHGRDHGAGRPCRAAMSRCSLRAFVETVSSRALTAFMSTRDRAAIDDAVIRAAARQMRGIGAGDQRLGRHAAGVDAGAAEQLALDHRDLHAGRGQPPASDGPAWPAPTMMASKVCVMAPLATISTAPTIATASSISAAGRSLPKAAARRAAGLGAAERADDRADDAGNQPAEEGCRRRAPIAPPRQAAHDDPRARTAAAPCGSAWSGSWSVISSPMARTVMIQGVNR